MALTPVAGQLCQVLIPTPIVVMNGLTTSWEHRLVLLPAVPLRKKKRTRADMNIYMDACSLQCIFDESIIALDHLQQMYDTFVQDAGDNNEQSFALKVNDALSNAVTYWRLLKNTVNECESIVVARFPKPELWESI